MALDLVQVESEGSALSLQLLLSCCSLSLCLLDLLNFLFLLGFVEVDELDVVVSLKIRCHSGFGFLLRHVFNDYNLVMPLCS